MLLIENIRVRFREWRDQSEDPDLVPRLRRVWETKPDTAPAPRPARGPVTLALVAARPLPLRRAS